MSIHISWVQSALASGTEPQTYGLGLPRDLAELAIDDDQYPDWPLLESQRKYKNVSGIRMKAWVEQVSDIALQSKDDGDKYWGRLPGTRYDRMTMDLIDNELSDLGFAITRTPFTIASDWTPKDWQATYRVGNNEFSLTSAYPVGKTAATTAEGISAEAIWLGIGAAPDFLDRDVKGKAVIIYSTFVPGGRSHSASKRAKIFNANQRASELGAAMIINIMAVPGDGQFNPLGAPSAKYGVPLITINQDEGFKLRDRLAQGDKITIDLTLEIEQRKNVKSEYLVATLAGISNEEVLLAAHTDGFFQGAMDNASGIASGLEIARFYAQQDRESRPRTLVFFFFPDHHHGETGLKLFEQSYDWEKVAMVLTLEHPAQTQLYWYNQNLMTSNAIGAFRWYLDGSEKFSSIVHTALREHGVSIYKKMNRKPKLTGQAPNFHIIDHVIYHTTLDIPELVPAEGLERSTRAFLQIIDQTNQLPLPQLRH